ncbi:hypothetical protein [Streptomyces sp. NPDC047009]|uniref:hypothetical protein n=1 Tax=Streptomyces sp. NPDC047009 TaxID=3154496 RepID=UPI0034044787
MLVLDMDDTQFGAVLMALGTSAQSDSEVLLTTGFIGPDIREDVLVVTGDHPSIGTLDVDHSEVTRRRACMNRTELTEDLRGLLSKVTLGARQHYTGAMFEQHPRLAGSVRRRFQASTSISVFMASVMPQNTDTQSRPSDAIHAYATPQHASPPVNRRIPSGVQDHPVAGFWRIRVMSRELLHAFQSAA